MKDEMDIVRRYANHVPVDVFGLIEELGIDYFEKPMGPSSSGRIDFNDPYCIITVNSEEGPQRRRFTAAHELAHYLLHRDILDGRGHLDRLFDGDSSLNPYEPLRPGHEVEANKFAADLLMPRSKLSSMYDPTSDNVRDLANRFQVSPAAMTIRLRALGLRR